MIPPGVDITDLSAQLADDRVAFANPELAGSETLQAEVASALGPQEGVAVIDAVPNKVADLRDVAQELADASGLDTVIVQSPAGVSAVSSEYSRAQLESAQDGLNPFTDQVTLLNDFHERLDTFSAPWALVLAALVVLCLCAGLVAWRKAVRA